MSLLDARHKTFIAAVSRFARERIAPRVAAGDLDAFPLDIWKAAGEAGLLGVAVPAAYGGGYGEIILPPASAFPG